MTTLFKIRQQVRTVNKAWNEEIFSYFYERPARDCYDRLIKDHPNEYFELVKVVTEEECLAFTPKFD